VGGWAGWPVPVRGLAAQRAAVLRRRRSAGPGPGAGDTA